MQEFANPPLKPVGLDTESPQETLQFMSPGQMARRFEGHPIAMPLAKRPMMSSVSNDSTTARRARRILVVEDSFENRDMLTRRLQRRGFDVCSAVDGASGVAMSLSEQPDVILMDVALGEMDGWQATLLIKADARTAHIPVIALTAHALESDREKSMEVGCADFDTKPVDLARLLGKIEGCLAQVAPRQADDK